MSREIKFRAWHKKRKKFYEVLHLHIKTIMNGGMWATCLGTDCIEQKDIHIRIQPGDCIIEQYTGLLDKNGKEIYEGDIVKGRTLENSYELFGFVLYADGEWLIEQDDDKFPLCTFSVVNKSAFIIIGNIHENPELLEP